MGTLADSLFNVLMSWVRALVNSIWALFTTDHMTLLEFLGKNWVMLVVIMLAAGLVMDWLVWLVTGSKTPEVIYNATLYLKVDTLFYYVTAVICIVRNSMQGLGERIVPLISSSLEMIGKIVIAATLVPMFGYPGVIAAEPIVWFIMIIPLLIKILRMPVWKQKT